MNTTQLIRRATGMAAALILSGAILVSAQVVVMPSSMYAGSLYSAASGGSVVTTPVHGSVYYTSAGAPVYYYNGVAYNSADTSQGTPILQGVNGTPSLNGLYFSLSNSQPIYYFSGRYFYPSTTVVTPGVPNTGVGGDSTMDWAILLATGLVAIGGMAYLSRRQLVR